MDPSVSGSALAALGDDRFVLSIRPWDGKLMTRGRIDSALMASEPAARDAGSAGTPPAGPVRPATGPAAWELARDSAAGESRGRLRCQL